MKKLNLEMVVVACVAQCLDLGFDSPSIAAALVRAAARIAYAHKVRREAFTEGAGLAFDAVKS